MLFFGVFYVSHLFFGGFCLRKEDARFFFEGSFWTSFLPWIHGTIAGPWRLLKFMIGYCWRIGNPIHNGVNYQQPQLVFSPDFWLPSTVFCKYKNHSFWNEKLTWDPPNGKFRKSSTQTCLGNLSPSLSWVETSGFQRCWLPSARWNTV